MKVNVMRVFFRYTWLPFYRRWALWYVRQNRPFRYAGLRLDIPPGVFHPGIYFSTPIFLDFLQRVDFHDKTLLDVGTGSGILALFAAQKGARVTAIDIHPQAVDTTRHNAQTNGLADKLTVLHSDLFDALVPQAFDFILINPPYYPREAQNSAEQAFFAGKNWTYFERLFAQLHSFQHPQTRCWMVLSEDCNELKIREIALKNGLFMKTVFAQKKWGEHFFIAQVRPDTGLF